MAVSVTVIKLLASDAGVLCWIVFVLNVGSTTVSGSAPFATPNNCDPGLVMAADDIAAEPDAVTLIVGDVLAFEGLVTSKLNEYVVPAVIFPTTVKVSVSELQAPFFVVVPSEKMVSPSSPASTRSTEAEADAPASPEMVIIELAVSVNVVSVTSVTVILFVCPGNGLLWPIALVVNPRADTGRR